MSEDVVQRRRPVGLGRGLSALLGDTTPVEGDRDAIRHIPIADIRPHPDQPRRHFDDAALDELAASIRAHGVLQPIVVRAVDEHYQIVAGERRWRAAQRARMNHVPAVLREFSDIVTLEVALIENIQREQLNAIEEGEAYRRLITDCDYSPDTLGRKLGKSRSHVANLIRLVDLPEGVRAMLADGRLSMGHARTLIGVDGAEALAAEIVRRELSVRATEAFVGKAKKPRRERKAAGVAADADIALLERQLSDVLGLKVAIGHGSAGGSVTVSYASLDQLDLICQRLTGGNI